MAYTNYLYYTGTFKGFKIPSQSMFDYYIERAGEVIDERLDVDVSSIITDYESEIKKCNCAIADLLYNEENGKELTSEKTLTYAVTYDRSKSKSLDQKINQVLNRYLMNTGLLFGGLNDFVDYVEC